MPSGRVLLNNKEVMSIPDMPKEFVQFQKEIKKALIQFGTMFNFDYDNDSVSIEYDLGDGFYANFYKTKSIRN